MVAVFVLPFELFVSLNGDQPIDWEKRSRKGAKLAREQLVFLRRASHLYLSFHCLSLSAILYFSDFFFAPLREPYRFYFSNGLKGTCRYVS